MTSTRREIPGTALDGMTTVIEIPPGVTSARHSHPGEDFGYVIAVGRSKLQVDGKPQRCALGRLAT